MKSLTSVTSATLQLVTKIPWKGTWKQYMKEGHTSAIYVEGIQKCTFYKILHKTVEKILLNALSVSMPPIEMILLKCIHSGEKSYKCSQCDFATELGQALKRHLMTHSGEKPNKCNQCQFSSITLSRLKLHIMRIHSGERPYKCNICPSAFTTASNLQDHRKNTQEKNQTSAKTVLKLSSIVLLLKSLMKHNQNQHKNKCSQYKY